MTQGSEAVTYTCNGCGFQVPVLKQHAIWCSTPLGRVVFWVHDEACAEMAMSNYREQPCRRIGAPKPTQQERFLGRSQEAR